MVALPVAMALAFFTTGSSAATTDENLALFERYVDALRGQARIPGVSAAIVQDGRTLWLKGFGFQDADARIAATPDTPYEIASLTKTFTSTLLMQCVERGTLSLDAPMRLFTSQIPEADATVRFVFSHTSRGSPSGSTYEYDGNRYAALTAVVDSCHGRPFRQALAREILDRVAMTSTVPGRDLANPPAALAALFDAPTLARYSGIVTRMAVPYQVAADGRTSRAPYPISDINGSAGLVSTVVDLAKYDAAVDARLFVTAVTQQVAWTNAVSTTTRRPLPYGLGWFVQDVGGTPVIWHYGSWPQFSALYLKVPSRNLTLILLANSGGLSDRFPLASGDVTVSPFAKVFLRIFAS